MQIKSSVALKGLDVLEKKLQETNAKVSEGIKATIPAHTERIAEKARSMAPEVRGTLKGAIETRVSKGGHYGQVRINENKAPHGHLVVYGSVKNTPNPFLHQARDALQGELKAALAANIKAALKGNG